MSILLTFHAKDRLKTRLKCNPAKFQRVAVKAWCAPEPNSARKAKFLKYQARFDENRENIRFRELMGFVFIFAIEDGKIKLITLY